ATTVVSHPRRLSTPLPLRCGHQSHFSIAVRHCTDGPDVANVTRPAHKEYRHENQTDERLGGRPGEGPPLLYSGTGLCQEGRFQEWPLSLLIAVSPEELDGTELQLALNNNPAAKAYQDAIYQQSQPAAMFYTNDVRGDYERIKAGGA